MRFKIICMALFLITSLLVVNAQIVKTSGKLHVSQTQLKDEHNRDVILRGMSLGWSTFHPRFYNAAAVDWLVKDWGINVIRAAMGIEPRNGYIQDPEGSKAKVVAVVNAAIKNNIYVIIDWHSHNINLKEAKVFFAEMAKTYGKNPHIIYEIFNEPDKETWPEVKAYSTEIISTIRAYDPDNIILVGNPSWDQDVNLPADDPIKGYKNLMYTCHFYADTHKGSLRERCEYALNKGLPLFISESAGMNANGDGPLNITEWNNWIEWAESKKISWVTWSVSDKNESCSVLKAGVSSEGGWKESDLKESGVKTRDLIRKYNLRK